MASSRSMGVPPNLFSLSVLMCLLDVLGCIDCADIGMRTSCGTQGAFKCGSKCVPSAWKCDGEIDCDDHTDEGPMCKQLEGLPCSEGYFRCGYVCRPLFWRCDTVADCPEGADEETEMCAKHERVLNCTEKEFKCSNQCVTNEWVCDGDNDCPGGSDEDEALCKGNHTRGDTYKDSRDFKIYQIK